MKNGLVSRTLHGCVDWNDPRLDQPLTKDCRTLHGCVDWNGSLSWLSMANRLSHPSWVRGLKQRADLFQNYKFQSHPSWVRGLKRSELIMRATKLASHPQGCVDWNSIQQPGDDAGPKSHPQGCVDWNDLIGGVGCEKIVALFGVRGLKRPGHRNFIDWILSYSSECVDWKNSTI